MIVCSVLHKPIKSSFLRSQKRIHKPHQFKFTLKPEEFASLFRFQQNISLDCGIPYIPYRNPPSGSVRRRIPGSAFFGRMNILILPWLCPVSAPGPVIWLPVPVCIPVSPGLSFQIEGQRTEVGKLQVFCWIAIPQLPLQSAVRGQFQFH